MARTGKITHWIVGTRPDGTEIPKTAWLAGPFGRPTRGNLAKLVAKMPVPAKTARIVDEFGETVASL